MTVIEFRLKAKSDSTRADLDIIHETLAAVFVQLGEKYGVYAVSTVALVYIAEAIQHGRDTNRPVEAQWIADLKERFAEALEGRVNV